MPNEVTVSLSHFEESGFGEKPVWWALVAEENDVVLGFAFVLCTLLHLEGPAHVSRRSYCNRRGPW